MLRVVYHKFLDNIQYPLGSPFGPPEVYLELKKIYPDKIELDSQNKIYPVLRDLLLTLGFDKENVGTKDWNPLGDLVKEGQNILIKPNFVLHHNPHGSVFCSITHPAIIRFFIDYSLLAVGREGRVTVGDTPLENCDFTELCNIAQLNHLIETIQSYNYNRLELIDLRSEELSLDSSLNLNKIILPGDPRGYTAIDLKNFSLFHELEMRCGPQNYYTLADYNVDHSDPHTNIDGAPNEYHKYGKHIYNIPNTLLEADLVINLAKMKTHKFAGVTLCLKNMIGICEGKKYMPHRRPGVVVNNGDSFENFPPSLHTKSMRLIRSTMQNLNPSVANVIRNFRQAIFPKKFYAKLVHLYPLVGDWYGNDTIWRTILDLNLILFHADQKGFSFPQKKRKFLGVIDGVIGQDHEGPMAGLPVQSNLLIVARDPVASDMLATYLMGLNWKKIPTLSGIKYPQCIALGGLEIASDEIAGNIPLKDSIYSFVPTRGWKGYLEDRFSNCLFESYPE